MLAAMDFRQERIGNKRAKTNIGTLRPDLRGESRPNMAALFALLSNNNQKTRLWF